MYVSTYSHTCTYIYTCTDVCKYIPIRINVCERGGEREGGGEEVMKREREKERAMGR